MAIFLDNANSTYPKPREVLSAINETASMNDIIPSDGYMTQMQRMVSKTVPNLRQASAELFGVTSDEMLVSTSASKAILNLMLSFLESGDRLVIGETDPQPILLASKQLERRGVTVNRIPYDKHTGIAMGNLRKAVQGARMLAISHSNNVTGTLLPIEEISKIARESHCLVLLDISHTAGRMPINLKKLDISCAVSSGHKFLYGPTGTALAFVSAEAQKSQAKYKTAMKPQAESVEDQTPNILGFSGLLAAVKFICSENMEFIRRHDKQLRELMIGSLEMNRRVKILAPDADEGVATISFTCKDYPPNVIARLLEERFSVEIGNGMCQNQGIHETLSTFPDGCCRISAGFLNSPSDVEFFATSLTNIMYSK